MEMKDRKKVKAKPQGMLMRKGERYYARSISLREDQIKRLGDLGVRNISELIQKLLDDWLLQRDKAKAAKLRERANLLRYKWRVLTGPEKTASDKDNPNEIHKEITRLLERAENIERNVKEIEENNAKKSHARTNTSTTYS